MKMKLLTVFFSCLILTPIISFAATITVPNPGGLFGGSDINGILSKVAGFIIGLIAILGIVFLVWGGIQYVTAGGDETQVEKAKDTITYAIIGLFVAAIAYAIETLIFTTLVG